MIRFRTSRFGAIEVPEEKVITFIGGLLGFPALTRYVLLEHKDTPVRWLQAVDDPDVAFIVAEPGAVGTDRPAIPEREVREFLGLEREEDLAVFLILRVEGDRVIANDLGPLVVNASRRVGVQAVLEGI